MHITASDNEWNGDDGDESSSSSIVFACERRGIMCMHFRTMVIERFGLGNKVLKLKSETLCGVTNASAHSNYETKSSLSHFEVLSGGRCRRLKLNIEFEGKPFLIYCEQRYAAQERSLTAPHSAADINLRYSSEKKR
jgi:hypothetical protein